MPDYCEATLIPKLDSFGFNMFSLDRKYDYFGNPLSPLMINCFSPLAFTQSNEKLPGLPFLSNFVLAGLRSLHSKYSNIYIFSTWPFPFFFILQEKFIFLQNYKVFTKFKVFCI